MMFELCKVNPRQCGFFFHVWLHQEDKTVKLKLKLRCVTCETMNTYLFKKYSCVIRKFFDLHRMRKTLSKLEFRSSKAQFQLISSLDPPIMKLNSELQKGSQKSHTSVQHHPLPWIPSFTFKPQAKLIFIFQSYNLKNNKTE